MHARTKCFLCVLLQHISTKITTQNEGKVSFIDFRNMPFSPMAPSNHNLSGSIASWVKVINFA